MLKIADVAAALGCSPWKARELAKAGAFTNAMRFGDSPAVAHGRNEWRVPRSSLDAYIKLHSK